MLVKMVDIEMFQSSELQMKSGEALFGHTALSDST